MSLLSGLDSHDRNPCDKWGRYSSSSTTVVGDFSGNPENDFVQLITLPPTSQPTTRRSAVRNLRQQRQKPIEIIDDKNDSKLRSNTDKNPKDFHAQTSNFTIPKTKNQTANEKSSKKSPQGEHLQSNGHRKVATQLQLMPNAQGRATKRTNVSENNTPKKLRRSWLHTSTPRGPDDDVSPQKNDGGNCSPDKVSPPAMDKLRVKRGGCNRLRKTSLIKPMAVHIVDLKSSQETTDEQMKSPECKTGKLSSRLTETPKSREEIRCPLCDDIITEAGCLTCPKSETPKSREEIRCSRCDDIITEAGCLICSATSDTESEDGFLILAKKKNEELLGSGFRTEAFGTGERKENSREKADTKTDETQTTCKGQVNIVSSESHDSDFIETSEVPDSNITQDDLFCPLCGEPRSKIGCGCSNQSGKHSTLKFYSRHRNGHLHKKYGEVSKIPTKRKRSSLNTKKNTKAKNTDPNQTTLDTPGQKKLPDAQKTRGRKKKVVSPKEPECVHISSDEDEAVETTGDAEANDNDDLDAPDKNDDAQDRMYEPMQDSTGEEIGNIEEKPDAISRTDESQRSLDDFKTKEKESLPGCTNGILPKLNGKKQKKVGQKLSTYREEEAYIFMMVKNVLVGELFCDAREPVEVRDGRILIKVTYKDEPLDFKLGKNDITSFKIHSEGDPLIAILTITSGWARKYVERYRQFKTYIDPHNVVYNKKHVMFILNETITGTLLEALIELIDNNLSDEPIVERISLHEANVEGKRIINAFANTTPPKLHSLNSSSSQSSNDLNRTKKCAPVVKTYSTRSKSSVIASSGPKTPSKTILVYQPSSKLDGVTITSEDMLCLEPSTYLNDVIIDFFLKYIIEEKLTSKDRERLHLFSTFFYDRLTQKNTNSDEPRTPTSMHRMVKSWTKNVDIFSKDFLIIPINESSHWYLVIICYPRMVADDAGKEVNQLSDEAMCLDTTQESSEEKDCEKYKEMDTDDFDTTLMKTVSESKKRTVKRRKSRDSVSPIKARPCILIFDSLGNNRRSGVISNLRNYLNCEWKERKDSSVEIIFDKDTLKGCYPKVPLQENFSDCGLYVLQYFESFFTTSIEDYKSPIDLRSWFLQDEMATKRQCIINVILELQAKAES